MAEPRDITGLPGMAVQFRCLRCGAVSDRPTGHLVRTYGVTTLAEAERRARCLRYIGGERCAGRAIATLIERLVAPEPGFANARPVDPNIDDVFPLDRQPD
ncbi:hypothetical protein [Brevundimonas sp.]|uniref:hypothetical protein n=1 Tax=Brevundimonas sp. TaxID=1871086 RepID=UPI002D68B49B|nr:hypothetical protein [Brevundimonas sp.]HYD26941.1 hypothetical protein [Brevundimonas sp.]